MHLASAGGKLRLVDPTAADDVAVAQLRADPATRRFLPFLPVEVTAEEMRQRREARARDPRTAAFHIHLVDDNNQCDEWRFAGTCSLNAIDALNANCTAGILVALDLHRSGVATDALYLLLKFAFETRGLHRVVFNTGTGNTAMRAWLERAGAVHEGTVREGWKVGPGQYADAVVYSILEREWQEHVKLHLERRLRW